MKIGVLTFHRSINNGAVIQCYSLVTKLKEYFPNDIVEVIDYHMPIVDETIYNFSWKRYFSGSFKHKVKQLLIAHKFVKVRKAQLLKKEVFSKVVNILPLSSKRIYSNNTNELFSYINETYDIVIAGSDAIWNYKLRGFPNPYFLDEKITCRKFSYAASCFGMNYEKISEAEKNKIKTILDSYEFIGVRDSETERMAKYIGTTCSVYHTCDPTVFLDTSKLPVDKDLFMQKLRDRGYDSTRKTIAVMGDNRMLRMIKRMFGNKYQIISLFNYLQGADVNLHDLTPYEWAHSFSMFDLTVTTYFHGTLLSLRNGTPVVCIALEDSFTEKHVAKVEDFLGRVGMTDCYFHTDFKKKNFSAIKARIEHSMNNPDKNEIIKAMNSEAISAGCFFNALCSKL